MTTLIGTLVLPDPADVRAGTRYGANGVEFTGTLGTLSPAEDIASPAYILRNTLIQLGYLTDPALGGDWPGYVNGEPNTPDNCVTLYDISSTSDGRSQISGELYSHDGVQVRLRSTVNTLGWAKASQLRKKMAEEVQELTVWVGEQAYLLDCVAKIGNVLRLGKDAPGSKRDLFTINVVVSLDPIPLMT